MVTLRWRNIAGTDAFHAARVATNRVRNSRRQATPYHDHDFAEVFWIDSGRGVHRINDANVALETGSLILMRPKDAHGIEPTGPEELRLTNIAFPRGTLDFLGQRYFAGQYFWQAGKFPFMRRIEPARLRRLNRWADELSESPRKIFYIERFLLNVLGELRDEASEVAPEGAPDWLARACRMIREREQFAGGVERFLALCGRSREHVARTVRQVLGTTPTGYVNRIRMAYARRQLEMGDREILEIALDCGLGNLSHFYRLFHEHAGTTPRAYRLAHRRPI
jgi:AraC family cel operon transcriptional repressor